MALRHAGVALAVAAMVATAGCGFLLGSEELSFEASAATAGDDALSETGYEEVRVTDREVTRTFEAAGQERNVSVTNRLAQYEKRVDLPVMGSRRAAVFVAFASPEVSVLGQEFNPIRGMSSRDLLSQFESEYAGLDVGEEVDSRSVETLGGTATLRTFEGTATLGGQEVEVYVHVTEVVNHGGDYVVALGIHPRSLDGEESNVVTLVESLQHDGE